MIYICHICDHMYYMILYMIVYIYLKDITFILYIKDRGTFLEKR